MTTPIQNQSWEPELELARIAQTTPSRAGQESVKCESAQILSVDGVFKHSEVDKIEQIRSLRAIDTRSRNEFEKCGLAKYAFRSLFCVFLFNNLSKSAFQNTPQKHHKSPIAYHSPIWSASLLLFLALRDGV